MGEAGKRCPRCQSGAIQRSGKSAQGKQRWMCKVCGRTFVARPEKGIPSDTRRIATSLICDGVPVPVVAKALKEKCSRRFLYQLKAALNYAAR